MEKFFLNSVWGVIILGAIGSIFAVFIIKIISSLFHKIFSDERKQKFYGRMFKPLTEGRIKSFLIIRNNDSNSLNAYLIYLIGSYIVCTLFLF